MSAIQSHAPGARPQPQSFEQIARMLSKEHGRRFTAVDVERICLRAQAKLARALRADRDFCEAYGIRAQ